MKNKPAYRLQDLSSLKACFHLFSWSVMDTQEELWGKEAKKQVSFCSNSILNYLKICRPDARRD